MIMVLVKFSASLGNGGAVGRDVDRKILASLGNVGGARCDGYGIAHVPQCHGYAMDVHARLATACAYPCK